MNWNLLCHAVWLLLLSLLISACAGTSADGTAIDQTDPDESSGICAVYETFRVADERLLGALDRPFRTFDITSVEWRHQVGLIRVEMWDMRGDEQPANELWTAIYLMEVVGLGHSGEQDGGWSDPELQAGSDLVADALERCRVDLSAGFLGLRVGV